MDAPSRLLSFRMAGVCTRGCSSDGHGNLQSRMDLAAPLSDGRRMTF